MTIVLLAIVFVIVAIEVTISFGYIVSMFRGAPYVPSDAASIARILDYADLKPGELAADLGSGDGRILVAIGKQGIAAHGYEIQLPLVLVSRRRIRKQKLERLLTVYWKSFWRADFSVYDVVIIYGMYHIMAGLEEKISRELKPGSRVITNFFSLPGWIPVRQEGRISLYVKQ